MHENCLYSLNSLNHSISSKGPSTLQNKINTLNILKFFIKDFLNYMNYMYLRVSLHTDVWMPMEPEEGFGSPGSRITGSYNLPGMGAGN